MIPDMTTRHLDNMDITDTMMLDSRQSDLFLEDQSIFENTEISNVEPAAVQDVVDPAIVEPAIVTTDIEDMLMDEISNREYILYIRARGSCFKCHKA